MLKITHLRSEDANTVDLSVVTLRYRHMIFTLDHPRESKVG